MDINLKIPAVEKLLDYVASGIGSIAGPMLASWKARKNAEAKALAAKGEVEAQKLLTEGQATTMGIIAAAQANARSLLVSPNSRVRGQLDFSDSVTQRIQFQEEKRQRNIETVVRQAASEIEGSSVDSHEPDHDWTARFFNDVQDASNEETQLLYAKILAGEVERPGSTSIKTLSILRDLDQSTAMLFRTQCSACICLSPDGENILDARVLSLGGDATQNSLLRFGLSFDNLNLLNEHGLIIADYKSWFDLSMCIGIPTTNEKNENVIVRVPFGFQNRYWILKRASHRKTSAKYKVSGVAMTKAGRELLKVVECQPVPSYGQELEKFFTSQGLIMTEVECALPQMVNTDLS